MYLGVDGGGTKTALVLIDRDGEIRATHLAPGSYYLTIGLDALGTVLADGVNAVLAKAEVRAEDLDFAFFGLPAYGEDSALIGALSRLPRTIPAGRCLSVRQRHDLRVGRFAALPRRHQRRRWAQAPSATANAAALPLAAAAGANCSATRVPPIGSPAAG